MAVALILRVRGLDAQLWLDEVSAMNSIRRPIIDIVSAWPGAASHILYELLAHLSWSLLGETPSAVRLPAVVFGVAGVWAFHRFTRQLVRHESLFLTALFAVSYHHIFFSQNARGYTALIFLYLLATSFLVQLSSRGWSWARGMAYAITVALAAYAHPLGGFVLAGHVAAVLGWAVYERTRNHPSRIPLGKILWSATFALTGVVLLYIPFARSMLAFAQVNAASPAEGPRLGLGLVHEVVEGLGAAFGGTGGVVAAAAVGGVGLVSLARTAGFGLTAAIAPAVVQGFVLVAAGVGLHPRYFAVVLPVVYVVGGYGVIRILAWLSQRAAPRRASLVHGVALALLLIASTVPLARYYRYPKQDFLGAAAAVAARANPNDARVAVRFAGTVLAGYYALPYVVVDSLEQLRSIEERSQRVWVINTLERLVAVDDSALVAHLHQTYRSVDELPGTVGDGQMRIYVKEP